MWRRRHNVSLSHQREIVPVPPEQQDHWLEWLKERKRAEQPFSQKALRGEACTGERTFDAC